jgi:hypothetical protein
LKAIVINASSKDTKLIHALIKAARRHLHVVEAHHILLEKVEEDDTKVAKMELDSKELAKIVASKVLR